MGARILADTPDLLAVQLDYPDRDCGVCERPAEPPGLMVPMFEGDVLPNDWEGEWGGYHVCCPCWRAQETLAEPMLAYDVALLAYPGEGRVEPDRTVYTHSHTFGPF